MKFSDTLSQSPDAIAREVAGELVILNLESGFYFGLSGVGSFVWLALENGDQSIDTLCDAVSAEFDVPRSEIEHDILLLANSLLEEGLVVFADLPHRPA